MSATLEDILGSPTILQLRTDVLTRLKIPSFPITDEFSGAVMRTLWEIEAFVFLDLVGKDGDIQKTVSGAFLETATNDWLTAVSRFMYEIDRVPATFSQQSVVLQCAAGFGPYIITAGRGSLANAAGQTFGITTGGTLGGGGTLTILVQSETPAASLGIINKILSPTLPGVSVQSAAIFDPGTGPVYGQNGEADVALLVRAQGRWPSLDAIDSLDRVEKWARASTTNITRVRMDPDPVNAGGVIVTVAGPGGPVAGGDVTTAQTYIDARIAITDYPTVQNASVLNVSATAGVVTIEADRLVEVQAAVELAWLAVLSATQIGSVVYTSELEQVLMDQPGVIDVVGLTINSQPDLITLTANQVPVKTGALTSQLTWVTV